MPGNGRFSGNPKTEWLDESGKPDRNMRLLEDFWYEDPDGRRWPAPKGSVIDGASIPAPLWSVVGSPYTGDYRRASVVHDVACDQNVPREQADRMFYFACLAGGCSLREAQLLYAGVRIGAWAKHIRMWSPDETRNALLATGTVQPTLTEQSIRTTLGEIAHDLSTRPPDLPFEELERLVNAHLSAKSRQSE